MQRLVRGVNRGVRQPLRRWQALGATPFGATLAVHSYQLGNGLRVHLLVDRSAPVLSYHTWFRVGSRHEKPGKTGLAHLFEHLMFNETEHLAAGEFDRRMEAAGGETNAATWTDWTYYHDNLPAQELELAVRLEADRMGHLVLRDPQVSSEKEVVANERRFRVDDDVSGKVNELLYATMFKKHPYHWPTIGWMPDIEGFTTDDCRRFYRKYYAPNNASVVIAGDIDEGAALGLIQDHYGGFRAARIDSEPRCREPALRRSTRQTLLWATPTEKLQIGYRAPAFGHKDWAPLNLLCDVLLGGRSSRLHQLLVHDREIAAEIGGSVAPLRDPGVMEIWTSMRSGHPCNEALRLIDREIARVRRHPLSEAELERAKNRFELGFLHGMETANGKAEQIGFHESVLGDIAATLRQLAEFRAVSADDVKSVAQRYLDPQRRCMIRVKPDLRSGKVREPVIEEDADALEDGLE